jgi:GNAT superfamily N-acetyltransferase
MVSEIPPLPGEAYGRDLRGAELHRYLRPDAEIRAAAEREAGLVAAIGLEGLRNNTALPDLSPFPVELEGASEIAVAIRRGERFLLARCDGEPVGVVRCAERREFDELSRGAPYLEISGLAVLPRWRGTGIGGELLATAEWFGSREGYAMALLRTTYEVGLVPWYAKQGYQERRTRQLTYPGSPTFLDVIMTKALRAATSNGGRAGDGRLRIVRSDGASSLPQTNGNSFVVAYGNISR